VITLVRLLRELRPDVVLSYTVKPIIWGGLAARFAGVPRTWSMITGIGHAFADGKNPRQRFLRALVTWLYRYALRGADGVFFQNHDDEAEFRRLDILGQHVRVTVINGSGVDLKVFSRQPLTKRGPVFLLLARLIADKGIREYREAARSIRARYPQSRFLLAGPLDENPSAIGKRELEQWVREGDIDYLGTLDDVRPALAECSVYVLPSWYREGRPRTILEAMAVGRAVVTTDSPGCRETVDDGVNGYLVPSGDSASLVRTLMRFIENPTLAARMGAESRRIAEEKYDVDAVNRVILETMGL
jgi:glycosyltransferase involved in cell wall biosynthesis